MATFVEEGILYYFVFISYLHKITFIILRKRRLSILNSIANICKNLYKLGLQFVGKYHIIHSVLESQALLIFLELSNLRKLKKD